MARERMEIGPVPADELCEQVGEGYSRERAIRECRAYAKQLERMHGTPPEGAYFKVTSNPHDFGTYHEVAVVYDSESEEAVRYAFKVEGDTPATWDQEARRELEL